MLKIDQIQHYAMSRWGNYLAWGITAIFVMLILWQFYGVFTSKTEISPNQGMASLNQQPQNINLSSLHLFGVYQPANLNPNQLPRSTLNIQLNGVFVAVPESLSQAVLTIPGESQKVYYQGAELTENAKLYQILSNSVIIQYNGELQSLLLPEQNANFGTRPASLDLPKSSETRFHPLIPIE